MNNCDKFKDLILTDYVDEELDQETHANLESHLLVCPACQRFAQEVKNNLVVPFSQTQRQVVPDQVWLSIKAKIEEDSSNDFVRNLIDRLLGVFSFPKFIPVLGSLVLVVFIGLSTLHHQQIQQAKEKEQQEYLVSILEPNVTAEVENNVGTTTIEKYFL